LDPLTLAAAILVVGTVLAMRAIPTRPAVVGPLAGCAAGILTDLVVAPGVFCVVPQAHVVGSCVGNALTAVFWDHPRRQY
jgi:hypothetical protein